MTGVVTIISWLLIPMGLLPVLTAVVLLPHVNSPSMALKERARLSLVLAFLGAIVAFLAANRILNWGIGGEWLVIPFGLALIAVDGASGMWLWQFLRGRFGTAD